MLVNKEFADKYYAILDKLKPCATIEVGAYDAEFSQQMARCIDSRNVWAFEALPNIYNEFKGQLEHINYINLAVSDKDQEVTIGELDRDEKLGIPSGASSILTRIKALNTTPIKVQGHTVDTLAKTNEIHGNVALWIDCEGANREVLRGAANTLKNTMAVYIEVELEEFWEGAWLKEDTVKFLTNAGFTLVDCSNRPVQQDLIFVRTDLLPLI